MQRSYGDTACPGNAQSDRLVFGIEGRCNEVVSGSQPQPIARVEHRKVLVMRIRVADEEARENPAQQAVRLRGNA